MTAPAVQSVGLVRDQYHRYLWNGDGPLVGVTTPLKIQDTLIPGDLATWGGSNVAAAKVMGVTHQVMRNTLMAFRREQRAPTNVALAQRYLSQIEARRVLPATSHKTPRSEPVFGSSTKLGHPRSSRDSRSEPIAKVTEHLLGPRLTLTGRTVTLVSRTGVRIVDLQPQILRKQMIEPAQRGGQPLHPSDASPPLLEHIPIIDFRQIQRPAIDKVNPGPHWRSVA